MFEKLLVRTVALFRKPWVAIVIAALATVLLALGIPRITFDGSIKGMIPHDNRDRVINYYYEDPERFGSSNMIFVGIDVDDAYSVEALQRVAAIESAINDLGTSLPYHDMARQLRLSDADGQKVVEALRSAGLGESNYAEMIPKLLYASGELQKSFGWDASFADTVARNASASSAERLFQCYQAPIRKTQSILSSDYITNQDDELVVEKLLEGDAITPAAAATLKERVASWDLYKDALVSRDGKLLTVIVTPTSVDPDLMAGLTSSISAILKKQNDARATTYLDGEPVIESAISDQMFNDLALLVPIVVIVVLGMLYLNFRNIQGVVYPAVMILISVVATLGIMGFCNIPLTIVGIAMPVLLVAIVSAYGIHQMNHYFLSEKSDKLSILDDNMKSVGLAILLSGITVMAGFGALATEQFIPIKYFGIFTAIGDLVGVLCALFVLPSMILLSRKPKTVFQKERSSGWINALLRGFDRLNFRHSGPVMIAAAIVCVLSVVGALQVKTELNAVLFFKPRSAIRSADNRLNEKLAGTDVINVIFDSDLSDPCSRGKTSGDQETPIEITTPEVLREIEQFSADVQKEFPSATKVLSINDPLKKMNQEMNGGAASSYILPDSKELISQYLLVFTGDISNVVTPNHDKLRISVTMKRGSTSEVERIVRYCNAYFTKDFLERNHIQVQVTGAANLYNVANHLLVDGMIMSIVLCMAVVFVLLVLILRSPTMSLIAMTPIAVTLMINFGLMGALKLPLNVATAIVSSIAIGIGVDYSIHFITWYRNELRAEPDIPQALARTIERKGRGILYNMFVVFGGFAVLALSNFVPLVQFGLLVAGCMIFSAVGALAIVPAMIRLLARKDYDFLYLGTRKRAGDES